MKNINIYFNRCFTQTAELIKILKNNDKGLNFKIHISHVSDNKYLKEVSDVFELEPKKYTNEEYIEYCLQFCIKNNIDVFIPRNKVTEISNNKNKFEAIGVKILLIGDYDTYVALNDKAKAYELLEGKTSVLIPPYNVVNNYDNFKLTYDYIKNNGFDVCIKPVDGIGGNGFKRIKENINPYEELLEGSHTSCSLDRIDYVLSNQNTFNPLMVLGYMEGYEYSIDCFSLNGELIDAVPRRKVDKYTQVIEPKEELIQIAKEITKEFNLSYLYNIQLKYHNNKPYLIEINTRMSAGTYKACMSGINLVLKGIMALLDMEVVSEMDKLKYLEIRENNECIIK